MATDLRLDPTYIVGMHWLRTMFDGILPFATLLFLNGKIFIGLKRVKHKIELHSRTSLATQTQLANGTGRNDQRLIRGKVCNIYDLHFYK